MIRMGIGTVRGLLSYISQRSLLQKLWVDKIALEISPLPASYYLTILFSSFFILFILFFLIQNALYMY